MANSTNPKPKINHNLYENTNPVAELIHLIFTVLHRNIHRYDSDYTLGNHMHNYVMCRNQNSVKGEGPVLFYRWTSVAYFLA